jgi:putative FmdB family regulatory protein
MPFYDYKCLKCDTIKEVKKRISDPHPTFCETCGGDTLIRIHTAPAHVEYKGKGWFKTDGKY